MAQSLCSVDIPQPANVIAAAAHRAQNPFPRLRPIITLPLISPRQRNTMRSVTPTTQRIGRARRKPLYTNPPHRWATVCRAPTRLELTTLIVTPVALYLVPWVHCNNLNCGRGV